MTLEEFSEQMDLMSAGLGHSLRTVRFALEGLKGLFEAHLT